jgi:hypothetical protein
MTLTPTTPAQQRAQTAALLSAFVAYLANYPMPMRDKQVVLRAWRHARRVND